MNYINPKDLPAFAGMIAFIGVLTVIASIV